MLWFEGRGICLWVFARVRQNEPVVVLVVAVVPVVAVAVVFFTI